MGSILYLNLLLDERGACGISNPLPTAQISALKNSICVYFRLRVHLNIYIYVNDDLLLIKHEIDT